MKGPCKICLVTSMCSNTDRCPIYEKFKEKIRKRTAVLIILNSILTMGGLILFLHLGISLIVKIAVIGGIYFCLVLMMFILARPFMPWDDENGKAIFTFAVILSPCLPGCGAILLATEKYLGEEI